MKNTQNQKISQIKTILAHNPEFLSLHQRNLTRENNPLNLTNCSSLWKIDTHILCIVKQRCRLQLRKDDK